MTEFALPDCLVFKFEELEEYTKKVDTIIYVLYDKRECKYIVRGQRKWTPIQQSCTYSYECDSIEDISNFLQYVICPFNRVNEILYNYDNLPEFSNDISFEFLNENDHSDYEISGYNDKRMRKNRLMKILRMLRKVSN
jgi:hypothetical protein